MSVDRYDLVDIAVLAVVFALVALLGRSIARDHQEVVLFSRVYGFWSIVSGAWGCVVVWQARALYFTVLASSPLAAVTDISVLSLLMILSGVAALSMRPWVLYPVGAVAAWLVTRIGLQLFGPLPLRMCSNLRRMMLMNLFFFLVILVVQWLAAVVYWRAWRTEGSVPAKGRHT